MAIVYRKSLKGIDELAFKTSNLPMRLTSYLMAVDGVSSCEELAAKNPHLPSMDGILGGLMQQGFIEPVSGSAAKPLGTTPANSAKPAGSAASGQADTELETIKANMVRDVSSLLGSDAAPVIKKIQNCPTRDDLFATMMGIKKIVTMYVDKNAAEKFAARYDVLSS
jgi:hypothetical protein